MILLRSPCLTESSKPSLAQIMKNPEEVCQTSLGQGEGFANTAKIPSLFIENRLCFFYDAATWPHEWHRWLQPIHSKGGFVAKRLGILCDHKIKILTNVCPRGGGSFFPSVYFSSWSQSFYRGGTTWTVCSEAQQEHVSFRAMLVTKRLHIFLWFSLRITQVSRNVLQNGVLHNYVCEWKIPKKVSNPFGGVLNPPTRYRAIWGVAAII